MGSGGLPPGPAAGGGGSTTTTPFPPFPPWLGLLWHPFTAYALGVLVLLAGPYLPLGGAGASAAPPPHPSLLLRRHGAAPGACGGGSGGALDIALVVATTEARVQEVAARRVAPARAGAHLYIAHGGGASAGASDATTCSLLQEGVSTVRAGACGEAPSVPPWNGAHHPLSSLTCRAVEGLCAAVEASGGGSAPPAYVALVSEDARFRWPRFLARQRAAPPAAATFVLTEALEGWGWGLPAHLKKPFWPRMPGFNATLVLTLDVATTLCALHRAAPLQLIGPPELFFGFLLSTLDRVQWYSQAQPKARALAGRCPADTFALGLDASAWAACAKEAGEEGGGGGGGDEAVADLGVWPYPDPLHGELRHDASGTSKAPPAAAAAGAPARRLALPGPQKESIESHAY